ncbi:MAG: sodium-dependent transporter, partial [Deltaproteobacteria bacterium]|nr:sodium-dependent transporter [Deltaproteobacteria bacterium]
MTGKPRENWSGSLGFILAAIGSAVGLGNVWRFPYVTGEYGGGAFFLIYIFCVFIVGIPVMLAEFLIGRNTQRDAVGAFRTLRPRSAWVFTGWLCVATGFIILSYYAVVGGWVLHYLYLAVTDRFSGVAPQDIAALFSTLAENSGLQIFWHGVFMFLTIAIVAGGINRGIELGNKVMMPALFFLLCGLVIYALQTPGAAAGIGFLFNPRWEQVGPQAVLEALGQALFSMSLGMAAMVTYGSYLSHDTSLPKAALWVAAGDTFVAVLAGLVVFPIVFSFGLKASAGPSLIFQTLPVAFSQFPGGFILAAAFFILLSFAALTSAMSLLEVVT